MENTVIDDKLDQKEGDVDDQDNDAGEIRARQQRGSKLRCPQINRARPELRIAIRANAVSDADECPAIRAHAALFHRFIVAAATYG